MRQVTIYDINFCKYRNIYYVVIYVSLDSKENILKREGRQEEEEEEEDNIKNGSNLPIQVS